MKSPRTLVLALLLGALLSGGAVADEGDGDDVLITLHLDGAEVRAAIALIAKQASANIIIAQDVKGEVTCLIRNIPWREALEHVAKIAGAEVIEEEHGILRIVKARSESDEPFFGKRTVVTRVYDVEDLLDFIDPLIQLRPAAREAQIELRETVVVVKGSSADHKAIERALVALREGVRKAALEPAQAGFEERIAKQQITALHADDLPAKEMLDLLASTLDGIVTATPKAEARMANTRFNMDFADASVKQVLDYVTTLTGVEWTVRGDGVLFYAEGDDPERWLLLTTEVEVEHRTTPITLEFGNEEVHETGPADLVAEINALRREIQALRKEVAEIKSLLTR